jgi:hypothetical protein
MTNEEAETMRRELSKHYGDQVLTVREFCGALQIWSRVAGNFITEMTGYGTVERPFDATGFFLAAMKSSLLGRLIYDRETLRATPCPECKGRWRGCFLNCPCGGCGWLPNVTPGSERGMEKP